MSVRRSKSTLVHIYIYILRLVAITHNDISRCTWDMTNYMISILTAYCFNQVNISGGDYKHLTPMIRPFLFRMGPQKDRHDFHVSEIFIVTP